MKSIIPILGFLLTSIFLTGCQGIVDVPDEWEEASDRKKLEIIRGVLKDTRGTWNTLSSEIYK